MIKNDLCYFKMNVKYVLCWYSNWVLPPVVVFLDYDHVLLLSLLCTLQTHPDARIFRNRFIQNYDQLFIIFGDSHEAAEPVDVIDVSPVRCGGKAKDLGKNVRWTFEMDRSLGKVLVEQVILGNKNRLDNKFKPAAYEAAVFAIKERFHLDLTKDHVRNRLKTWKKQYDILQELLDQRDFEWDERRKMVIANDSAWNEYVKVPNMLDKFVIIILHIES